jgi:hypothetical protein
VNASSDTLVPIEDVWPVCDPYVSSPERDADRPTAHGDSGDHLLAPPDPAQRLNIALSPADRRRLDLFAALTVRGIAPLPGDQDAVAAVSSLGDAVTASILRWVASPSI